MNFSTIIMSSPAFSPTYPALWTPRRGEKSCKVPGRQCGVIKLQVINDICRTIACDCAVIISIVCSTLSAALCLALSQPWLIDIKQATHTFLIPVALHPAAGVIRPLVSGSTPTLLRKRTNSTSSPSNASWAKKPTKVSMFELLKCLIGDMNMKLDVFSTS